MTLHYNKHVPPGVIHCVVNLQPCVKVGMCYMCMGPVQAKRPSPIQQPIGFLVPYCAKNDSADCMSCGMVHMVVIKLIDKLMTYL